MTTTRRTVLTRGAAGLAVGVAAPTILAWPAGAAEFAYKYGTAQPDGHPMAVPQLQSQRHQRRATPSKPYPALSGRINAGRYGADQSSREPEVLAAIRVHCRASAQGRHSKPAPHLNRHKAPGSWQCSGRTDYLIDTRY
jgi:hypothetical protein